MSRRRMSSTRRDARLARNRQAPKVRPPDQAGRGAERHRLDHVAAAPDAAVDQHRHAAFDRLGHARQSPDRGHRPVQLAAAVVGDDHAVDAVIDRGARVVRMQDALQEQRPRPDLAQPGDIAPAQRRVEQVVDVPGEREDVLALVGDVVRERDGPAARHADQPGHAAPGIQAAAPGDPRRDREAVAQIALALAEYLVVDGQHQRPVAGRLGALGKRPGEAPIAIEEHLEPFRSRHLVREILDGDGRAVAHRIDDAGLGRGAGGGGLAARPEHAGEAGRPDDHRQRQPLAEQLDRRIARARAVQRLRQELEIGERALVAIAGDLVLGAAVAEVEHHARQAPARERPHRRDAVCTLQPRFEHHARSTRIAAPERTERSVFTSSCARPQMLQGLARRHSSPCEIGVRPKPIAIASPSGQNASSPGSTTARASASRAERYRRREVDLVAPGRGPGLERRRLVQRLRGRRLEQLGPDHDVADAHLQLAQNRLPLLIPR